MKFMMCIYTKNMEFVAQHLFRLYNYIITNTDTTEIFIRWMDFEAWRAVPCYNEGSLVTKHQTLDRGEPERKSVILKNEKKHT